MKVYENEEYREDIKAVAGLQLPWEMFENSSILISGASGLVGSYLIDVIMRKNANNGMNCTIYALGRNKKNAKERFGYCWDDSHFRFISHDINTPLQIDGVIQIGYVLHLASNTHPVAYATDPIG